MTKDIESIMQDLPEERRVKIEQRAKELIDGYIRLQDIRKPVVMDGLNRFERG